MSYVFSLIFSILIAPFVILITIDGVRWQEIYYGIDKTRDKNYLSAQELFPNLYLNFVEQGIALGRDLPMVASGPNFISLPGYLEITRGHPSTDCQNNYCNPIIDQSIFYWFNNSAVFASWNKIIKTIPPNGSVYFDIENKYRADQLTELSADLYLKDNNSEFLWISLGDPDEWAHVNNYHNYIKSLQDIDQFIGSVVCRYPSSFILVTTDHGRDINFIYHGRDKYSSRVWLMMRGPNIKPLGFVNIKANLSNIYPTILDYQFGISSKNSILFKIKEINNGRF